MRSWTTAVAPTTTGTATSAAALAARKTHDRCWHLGCILPSATTIVWTGPGCRSTFRATTPSAGPPHRPTVRPSLPSLLRHVNAAGLSDTDLSVSRGSREEWDAGRGDLRCAVTRSTPALVKLLCRRAGMARLGAAAHGRALSRCVATCFGSARDLVMLAA